jgi:chemotaxis protein methyltransferase CheR
MDSLNAANEIDILLFSIYQVYKMDFTHYKRASLQRRIELFIEKKHIATISDLIPRIMHDATLFHELLTEISVPVTEWFRDPHFFLALRNHVLPILNTYPVIKVWVAGCATGEEAYSLACMLYEENMLEKTTLYATDLNATAINQAKQGQYTKQQILANEKNYSQAGGKKTLTSYFTFMNDIATLNHPIINSVKFDFHNITHGSYISGLNLILCRNVFIYFDKQLQNDVVGYFMNSLRPGGFLGLGDKESIQYSQYANYFDTMLAGIKIFRRRYL